MTRTRALQLLGLDDTFDAVALDKAWKQAARDTHPDRGGTSKAFIAAREAYETLLQSIERGTGQKSDESEQESKSAPARDLRFGDELFAMSFFLDRRSVPLDDVQIRLLDAVTGPFLHIDLRHPWYGSASRIQTVLAFDRRGSGCHAYEAPTISRGYARCGGLQVVDAQPDAWRRAEPDLEPGPERSRGGGGMYGGGGRFGRVNGGRGRWGW